MILRVSAAGDSGNARSAWESFAKSQKLRARLSGYVSQPAHAKLAGQLASALIVEVFGQIPADVIEAVAQHDLGWSWADLTALESACSQEPASFLEISSEKATEAWTRSIHAASERSALQEVLTSRHFCLLAPRDGDAAHERFVREQNARCESLEARCGASNADLERYTTVLGFCDLLSLLLCSGLEGRHSIPLKHPAHPEANNAGEVVCRLGAGSLSFERPVLRAGSVFFADGWDLISAGRLTNQRYEWRAE